MKKAPSHTKKQERLEDNKAPTENNKKEDSASIVKKTHIVEGKEVKAPIVSERRSTSKTTTPKSVVATTKKKSSPKTKEEATSKKKSIPIKASQLSEQTDVTSKSTGDITVVLELQYHTELGQSIWVTSSGLLLGDSVLKQMYYHDNEHWRLELTLKPDSLKEDIHYRYHVKNTDGNFLDDYEEKTIPVKKMGSAFLFIRDFWSYAGYYDNVYYKAPFDYLIQRDIVTKNKEITLNTTHLFHVKVPYLLPNEAVCILGSDAVLGSWQSEQFQKLAYDARLRVWKVQFSINDFNGSIEYKYGIYNKDSNQIVRLENGDNRRTFSLSKKGLVFQNDGFIRIEEKSWKGAGLNIPLFSIRTGNDFGIGDLGSVKLIIDWMSSVGLKLLQLLPINDTTVTRTWKDSYPYSAISVFAIHPIYMDIEQLLTPERKSIPNIKNLLEKRAALSILPQLDYEAVFALKWQLIETVYPIVKKEIIASSAYKSFIQKNEYWLKAYAAFSVLRDQYGSANYDGWANASQYSDNIFEQLFRSQKDRIQLYFFVQFILSMQLKDAVGYAHKHHIALKGDIPIGVDRYSVDVWQNPTIFNTTMQAGAPPDFFTKEGQNWSFPTYEWDIMERDNYSWWRSRLSYMSQYFDAIRIDHILGFFRIWSIPEAQVQGILGYFQPCMPVDQQEFSDWKIPFDYDRYCKPFINDEILLSIFGDKVTYIQSTFLRVDDQGRYEFIPEYNTQKKIKVLFDSFEHNAHNTWLLHSLMELMANIILIPDKQPLKYHFRYEMYSTSSYAYLSNWEKKQLYYLYINYFFERQENHWEKIGYRQLSAITYATDMMICGEDLGMVPEVVPTVMGRLGILGLKVQRMASDNSSEFTNPLNVSFLNVVTPTTHDMPPLRNWWMQEPMSTKDSFYKTQLHLKGYAPEKYDASIVSQIIFNHLQSPALWSIFLIQDLFAMEEDTINPNMEDDVINRPEIVPFYWCYRMHLSVENLMKKEGFNGKIKNLLQLSNR